MAIDEDLSAGDGGHTAHHIALAQKANQLDQRVGTDAALSARMKAISEDTDSDFAIQQRATMDAAISSAVHDRVFKGAPEMHAALGSPTLGGTSSGLNPWWLVDGAVAEGVSLTVRAPADMKGWGRFAVDLWWAPQVAAGAGDVVWRFDVSEHAAGDALAVSTKGPEKIAAAPAPNTIARTRLGVIDVTDPEAIIALRATRLSASANDTLTADAGILGVELVRADGQLAVVALGDSITDQSMGASGWLTVANTQAGNPVTLLPEQGIGGQKAAAIHARVPDVIALKPDWCVLMAGTNNAYDPDPAPIIAELSQMYDELSAAGIGIVIATVTPRAYTQGDPQVLTDVNAWIRSNWRNWPNTRLCDWNPALRVAGGTEMEQDPALFNEGELGVHPNTAGMARMADVLAPVFVTLT